MLLRFILNRNVFTSTSSVILCKYYTFDLMAVQDTLRTWPVRIGGVTVFPVFGFHFDKCTS